MNDEARQWMRVQHLSDQAWESYKRFLLILDAIIEDRADMSDPQTLLVIKGLACLVRAEFYKRANDAEVND